MTYDNVCKIFFCNENDILVKSTQVVKENAPFGKVFVLFDEHKINLLPQLNLTLHKTGNKIVFIEEDDILSSTSIGYLLNAHEDVRAVFCLSPKLIAKAEYFCSLKNIPLIALTDSFSFNNLSSILSVQNNDNIDLFWANCKKTLLISKQNFPDKKELFAFIIDCKISIFDYYARSIFSRNEFDVHSVNIILSALDNLKEQVFKLSEQTDFNIIEELLSQIVSVDRKCGGKVFCFTPSAMLSKALKKEFNFSKKLFIDLYCVKKLNKQQKKEQLPTDYNKMAENVAKVFSVDMAFAVHNLMKMVKIFSLIDSVIVNKFNYALKKLNAYLEEQLKEYITLGGKNIALTKTEKEGLELIAFNPYKINLMTIAKEITFKV